MRFCVHVRIRKKERPYRYDITTMMVMMMIMIMIIIIIIITTTTRDLFITIRLAVYHCSHAYIMPYSYQIRAKELIKV